MILARLNWICWGLFALVWVLGAIYNSYSAPGTIHRRFRYDWLIFAGLAWVVMHYVPRRYLTLMSFHVPWLQVVGAALLVAATLFTLWSRWVLGKMWASNAQIKAEHQLVTDGPYQVTRHPIYTGILGMVLGSALSLGAGAMFLGFIILMLFFLIRIHNEEQLLIRTFGEQYVQYKERVPQLIPGLKIRRETLR